MIARLNSPIIAPDIIAMVRILRGRRILFIVKRIDPRHSFATATIKVELSKQMFVITNRDLFDMHSAIESRFDCSNDEHMAL